MRPRPPIRQGRRRSRHRPLYPVLLGSILLAVAGCDRSATGPSIDPLTEPLAAGEAVVWYLGSCGWAVRTADHLLVFDYLEWYDGAEQKIHPPEPALSYHSR